MERKNKYNTYMWEHAASIGNIRVFEWLKENQETSDSIEDVEIDWDFPSDGWSENTCLETISNGHLEALQWLIVNGCPWNRNELIDYAKQTSHTDIAKWIEECDIHDTLPSGVTNIPLTVYPRVDGITHAEGW